MPKRIIEDHYNMHPIQKPDSLELADDEWGFVCAYGIGDTYFVCILAREFLNKHGGRIVMVVSPAHEGIVKLFPHVVSRYVVRDPQTIAVDKLSRPCQGKFVTVHPFHHPLLGGQTFESRLGEHDLFHTFKVFLDCLNVRELSIPAVSESIAQSAKERLENLGLPPGNTVILAPECRSTPRIGVHGFWEILAETLDQIGWKVCTNVTLGQQPVDGTTPLEFPLEETIPIVEQAGWLISVRSGLCDLASSVNTHLSVVYPASSWHQGTVFSIANLRKMGLSSRAFEHEVSDDVNLSLIVKRIISDVVPEFTFKKLPHPRIFHGKHKHWNGNLLLFPNGKLMRPGVDTGTYEIEENHTLLLKWYAWPEETLYWQPSSSHYQSEDGCFILQEASSNQPDPLSLDFVDFWHVNTTEGKLTNGLFHFLNRQGEVVLDENQPDAVVCSCFGETHKSIPLNIIKIQYLGENHLPDLNHYDCSFSFDREENDRKLRLPLYLLYDEWYNLMLSWNDPYKKSTLAFQKRKFCGALVSNGDCEQRNQFMALLSERGSLESGGSWMNNTGRTIPRDEDMDFRSQYRFFLAFENSSTPGYITEKILSAMAAGCIPVYWGAEDIGLDFNEESFINCHNYNDFNEVIDRMLELACCPESLNSILSEPWLHASHIAEWGAQQVREKALAFLRSNIDRHRNTIHIST